MAKSRKEGRKSGRKATRHVVKHARSGRKAGGKDKNSKIRKIKAWLKHGRGKKKKR